MTILQVVVGLWAAVLVSGVAVMPTMPTMPQLQQAPNTSQLVWPSKFSMQFITAASTIYASSGTLYYNDEVKATRMDHSAGSHECAFFYNSTGSCSLFFTEVGLSRWLHEDNSCCIDMPILVSLARDWMLNASYVDTVTIGGRPCFHWTNVREYYTTAVAGADLRIPCAYEFTANSSENVQFLFETWTTKVHLPEHFMLPPRHCTKPCNTKNKKNKRKIEFF
jgi:hypothetical protein